MRRRTMLTAAAAAVAAASLPRELRAAVLPEVFLDCVVAIGFVGPGVRNGVAVERMWHTIGTGFFWGTVAVPNDDASKRLYDTYLVTAAHVVTDCDNLLKTNPKLGPVKVRVNPLASATSAVEFDLFDQLSDSVATWIRNPNSKDISVISVNLAPLRDKQFSSAFFPDDLWAADTDKLRNVGVGVGDGVFVLGFPMDMAGDQRNYVIVREGIVARIAEMLDGAADYFLVDSFIFPGNSGGPVILRPENAFDAMQGTKANSQSLLIGVVVESISYVDNAVSQQTGRPRVSFEENAGLGKVLPVDYIRDAVSAARLIAKPAPATSSKPRPAKPRG
jgi:S1-C subfamily serine protease